MILSNKRRKANNKCAIRLRGSAGWSAPLLFANPGRQVFSRQGPYGQVIIQAMTEFVDSHSSIPRHCLEYKAICLFLQLKITSQCICNSYTMGCLPVHGDNPQALASGLS